MGGIHLGHGLTGERGLYLLRQYIGIIELRQGFYDHGVGSYARAKGIAQHGSGAVLIAAKFIGQVGPFDGAAIYLEGDPFEVGVIDVDDDVEVIGTGIEPGRETFGVILLVPVAQLPLVLVDVHLDAGDRFQGDDVGVVGRQITGAGHRKSSRVVVYVEFPASLTEGTGDDEGGGRFLVLFPVFKLLLDLLGGGCFPVMEKGGQLIAAVAADLAVGDGILAKGTHFLTAGGAISLIGKSVGDFVEEAHTDTPFCIKR